jgi:hypothetical protein
MRKRSLDLVDDTLVKLSANLSKSLDILGRREMNKEQPRNEAIWCKARNKIDADTPLFTLLDSQPKAKEDASLAVCNTTSLPARILGQHRKDKPAATASNEGVLQPCEGSAETLAVRIRKSGHLIVAQNQTLPSSTALKTPLPSWSANRMNLPFTSARGLRHHKQNSSPLGQGVWALGH